MDYRVHYTVLRRTSLFRSMSDADLDVLMGCFSPHIRRYRRGELLLMAGYETRELGIVLEGEITAAKPMPDGSAVVMTHMGPGGVFADVLAGGRNKSPVTVTAALPCRVLYLPCEALLRPCVPLHKAHLRGGGQGARAAAAQLAGDHQQQVLCPGPAAVTAVLQKPAGTHLPVAAGAAGTGGGGHLHHAADAGGTCLLPEL